VFSYFIDLLQYKVDHSLGGSSGDPLYTSQLDVRTHGHRLFFFCLLYFIKLLYFLIFVDYLL
jgi:hypothetical protein